MTYPKIFYLSAFLAIGSLALAEPASPPAKRVASQQNAIDAAIKVFDSGKREEIYPALEALKSSGDLRILARLGMCYHSGTGVEKDLKKAHEYFCQAEASPDGWGIYGLGICYHEGVVVARDLDKAEKLLKAAYAKGVIYAAGDLGFIAWQKKDMVQAKKYFSLMYDSKNLPAYWRGIAAGMLGNLSSVVREKITYWEQAAAAGLADYCASLALLYNSGKDIPVDPEKAFTWAELYSTATGHKDIYAGIAFEIAIEKMFLGDDAAKKYMIIAADNGEARAFWYAFKFTGDAKYALAAARKGDVRAYNEAGAIIQNNPNASAAEQAEALKYHQIASTFENSDGRHAVCNQAARYARDHANKASSQKAFELYKSTADWFFYRGLRGVAISYLIKCQQAVTEAEQIKYYLLALENLAAAAFANDDYALNNLEGFSEDAKALSNTPEAKLFLGVSKIVKLRTQNNPPELYTDAINLVRESAQAGNAHANMIMALLPRDGVNIKEDLYLEADYLRKAARKGNLTAKLALTGVKYVKVVSPQERFALLGELIKHGSKTARYRYAMLSDLQGDKLQAIKLHKENAALGYSDSMVDLFFLLYQSNDKNIQKEAFDYLDQAVKLNNGKAQCVFAGLILGLPNTIPRVNAIHMLKGLIDEASEPEYDLHQAAMFYAEGYGVKKSPQTAEKICQMMISNGYPRGYLVLGTMHQKGLFGKVDLQKARECYRQGAALGDENCINLLKQLEK